MQRGPRNGGSISLPHSTFVGPSLRFASGDFRALLTPDEDARFTWRKLIGPPRARKPFFELVGAEVVVPLVKPVGALPSGWWCEACGFETSPFTSAGWKGSYWHVALADLPRPLPDVFAVGTAPDLDLCFTRNRWRASIELPGAKGCRSSNLGVLRDEEIDHAPVRETWRHQQAVVKQMKAESEAGEAPRLRNLQVALGEYDSGWHAPVKSLAAAGKVIRAAKAAGADLVVLPEACITGLTSDASRVEPLDGPRIKALGEIASKARKHVAAGVALRDPHGDGERVVNAILRFDTHGEIAKHCRKQRLSAAGGNSDMDADSPAVDAVYWVRLAYFAGAELRSSEPFRAVAKDVDAMIVLANWPAAERAEWDALLRARAIENRCYVLGVNRTGKGGGVEYGGGSTAFDPYGEPAVVVKGGVPMVEVRQDRVKAARSA
jgi:predicted amidohydrolase